MNLEGLNEIKPINTLHPSQEEPKIPELKFKLIQEFNEHPDMKSLNGRSFSKKSSETIENKFFLDLKLLTGLVIKIFDAQETPKPDKVEPKKEESITPTIHRIKDVIHGVVNALSPRERSRSLEECQILECPQKQIQKLLPTMMKKLVDIKDENLIDQFVDQLSLIEEHPFDSSLESLIKDSLATTISLKKTKKYLDSWGVVEKLPNQDLLFFLTEMPRGSLKEAYEHFNQIKKNFDSYNMVDTETGYTYINQVNIILEKMDMLPHWISEQDLANALIGYHTEIENFYDILPYLGWLKEVKFIKKSLDAAISIIEDLKLKNESINQPLCSLISSMATLLKEKPFIWSLSPEDKKHFEHTLFSIQDLITDQIDKSISEKIITNFEILNTSPYIKRSVVEPQLLETSFLPETLDIKDMSNWIPDLVSDFRTYFSWHLSSINSIEFANEAWAIEETRDLTSPNIISHSLKYDNISLNVANLIISEDKATGKEIIKGFCKLLEELIIDKNYPAVRSIFLGLDLLPSIRNSKTLAGSKVFDLARKLSLQNTEYKKDFENSVILYKEEKIKNPPLLDLGYFLKGFTALNVKTHKIISSDKESSLISIDKALDIKNTISNFNTLIEPVTQSILQGEEKLYKCIFFSKIIGNKNRDELDQYKSDLKLKDRKINHK